MTKIDFYIQKSTVNLQGVTFRYPNFQVTVTPYFMKNLVVYPVSLVVILTTFAILLTTPIVIFLDLKRRVYIGVIFWLKNDLIPKKGTDIQSGLVRSGVVCAG